MKVYKHQSSLYPIMLLTHRDRTFFPHGEIQISSFSNAGKKINDYFVNNSKMNFFDDFAFDHLKESMYE
jgi:hypothetical protein